MIPYNSEFIKNEPDYIFNDLMFIGTCGSFPEQYDVVYKSEFDQQLYQVGYVRLRGSKLYCAFPDVGENIIYYHEYSNPPSIGSFPNEVERVYHLEQIALKIKQTLESISYGFS